MNSLEIHIPLQVALDRKTSNYVAGSFSDGRKLGLAIGGGGGSGSVTLGYLEELRNAGVLQVIDVVTALSVGAINISAVVAGQTELALKGYDTMTEKGFIQKRRIHRIFDMKILERLLRGSDGLDTNKINDCTIPLLLGVTQLTGGIKPITIDLAEQDPENIVDWLMRGAHQGIAAGPAPKDKKGIVYVDGGYSHLSAVDMAVQSGCTDVIYLSNHPYKQGEYKGWQVALFGAGFSPYDIKAIPNYNSIFRRQIASLATFKEGSFNYMGAEVAGFFPADSESLPKLINTDPRKVKAGFDIGKLHILEHLAPFLTTKPIPT